VSACQRDGGADVFRLQKNETRGWPSNRRNTEITCSWWWC